MLTRKVNGREVVLSAEEEAAVRAEWAIELAKQEAERAKPKPLSPHERLLAVLVEKRVLTKAEADALA